MNDYPSLFHTYRWIRKNRFQKKLQIYRQALATVLDITISIYLFFFLIISLIALQNWLREFEPIFSMFENVSNDVLFLLFGALIIRAFIFSYRNPGVYVTSTEYQLSLMPYIKERIWLYCLKERVLKLTFIFFVLHVVIFLLTPLSYLFISKIIFIIWIAHMAGIAIQWRLFQDSGFKKIAKIFLVVLLFACIRYIFLSKFIPSAILLWLFISIVTVGAIILLFYKPLRHVDWVKVVSYSDIKVWSMYLVESLTKVPIKPPKKYQLFNKLFHGKKAKKPLPYDLSVISIRLWRVFLKEHGDLLLKLISTIFLLIIGLGLQGKWLLSVSIPLAIFIMNQMVASLFAYQFQQPILHALPWRFRPWFQSFKKWYVVLVFFVSLAIAGMLLFHHISVWAIGFHLLFYILWMYIDLFISILVRSNNMIGFYRSYRSLYLLRLSMMVAIFFSLISIWISMISTILLVAFVLINNLEIKDVNSA
ncbi:hypothetical protein HNQ94_002628 [Salirhabdus euzebyi]|uniref:Uncharacterized protein n=1 Tax=Salirhabdus euzebyi TaxID=394506 RepID=A0A841Q781_9BACI|nr:hypothetical protein [Salirhabdus euzebyi]MBB6454177.1 hypothetical protein [Salirhabdus euzebyi]